MLTSACSEFGPTTALVIKQTEKHPRLEYEDTP